MSQLFDRFSNSDRQISSYPIFVALIEMPDDKSMAAALMVVGSSGALANSSTTKLIPMDDALAAMKQGGQITGQYKPPTS